MKFKLFGGLECPDTFLAQLSIVGNTDIASTKALAALTDHVVAMVLLQATYAPSAVGDDTLPTLSSGDSSQQLTNAEVEIRAATLNVFADALKPIVTPSASDRFDGFAAKAVSVHEQQRLQRAKAAAAAAKKFVVGTTAAEIEQLSLQPASIAQQLSIAENALSQSLSALSHIITNIARFGINDESLLNELTMLGMAPEAVEVIKSTAKSAIGAFKDRSSEEGGDQSKGGGAPSSSASTKMSFIFSSEGSAGGASSSNPEKSEDEATSAEVFRRVAIANCPKIGAANPIGSITPYTRTSTIGALRQVVVSEEVEVDEEGNPKPKKPLEAETLELAEGVLLNTNEDSAQVATTTGFVRISTHGGRNIDLTQAQARTLLNELISARDIMRGITGDHE